MPLGGAIVAGGWFQPDYITKIGAKAVLKDRLPHFTQARAGLPRATARLAFPRAG